MIVFEKPEDGKRNRCKCDIIRDAKGLVTSVNFTPGRGYGQKEKKVYRVYHLFYSNWKEEEKEGRASSNSSNMYSFTERAKDTELSIEYVAFDGEKVRKVVEDEANNEKVRYVTKNGDTLGLDLFKQTQDVTPDDFKGKNRSFDTISMVTFELDANDEPTLYDIRVPRLKSATSKDVYVKVAFRFDVDMGTHLNAAAKRNNAHSITESPPRKCPLSSNRLFGNFKTHPDSTNDNDDNDDVVSKSYSIVPAETESRENAAAKRNNAHSITESPSRKCPLSSNCLFGNFKTHPDSTNDNDDNDDVVSKLDNESEDGWHSRFDTSWTEFLASPELFTEDKLEKMFNFVDGVKDYKKEMDDD
jgi:hypothetical protein